MHRPRWPIGIGWMRARWRERMGMRFEGQALTRIIANHFDSYPAKARFSEAS